MATYSSLKTEIENNGWTVVNETTGNTANQITSKTITAGRVDNGALKTKTFAIAKYEVNGEHYWQDADPFQDSTWYQEVQTFFKNKRDSVAELKSGYIINSNSFLETAIAKVTYDNSGNWENRYYEIWKENDGTVDFRKIDSPIT